MEIEFRGKRTSDGMWVYGYYVSNPRGVLIDVIYCKEDAHEVLPETVSLFIGETDCNGKKLYEHDILRYITSTGENHYKTIKFTPERAAFCGANVAERVQPRLYMRNNANSYNERRLLQLRFTS